MSHFSPAVLSLLLAASADRASADSVIAPILGATVGRAQIVWLITAIVLLFLVLVAAILFLRQRAQAKQNSDIPKAMYSLHELRRLRRKGEISEEEFEKLKDVVNIQTRKQGPHGPAKPGP